MKRSRSILWATSALVLSGVLSSFEGSAQAQTVPNGTWNISAIDLTATNGTDIGSGGTSTLVIEKLASPTISGGTNGSISAAAVGASSSNSVAVLNKAGNPSLNFNFNGTVTVSATNSDAVSIYTQPGVNNEMPAASTIETPTISNGTGNSISVAGVGASASNSVALVSAGTLNQKPDTPQPTTPGSNNVTYSGKVTLNATNQVGGDVTVSAKMEAPVIEAGGSNSISLAAVGASASNSVSTLTSGSDPIYPEPVIPVISMNTVETGSVEVNATNNGSVNVAKSGLGGTNSSKPSINNGLSNSISVAGVGASASNSVSNSALLFGATTGEISVGNPGGPTAGTLALTATNGSDLDPGTTGGVTVSGGASSPSITHGQSNSISLAAVGASASSSVSNVAANGGSLQIDTTVTDTTVTAKNSGTVNFDAISGLETAEIGVGEPGTSYTSNSNSISLAAVGASSSNSVSNVAFFGEMSGDVAVGTVKGASKNMGNVTLTNGTINNATIFGGTGNSVSVAGVGASSSNSISVTNVAGGMNGKVDVGDITLGSSLAPISNSGNVLLTGGQISGAVISGGLSNSISLAAVGSSGSNSVSNVTFGGTGTTTNAVQTGSVSINAKNSGDVKIENSGLSSAPTINGGYANSISVAGVGASASSSVNSTAVNLGTSAGTIRVGGNGDTVILNATNRAGADVDVMANSSSPEIKGGTTNSVSIAAVGASASSSVSNISATGDRPNSLGGTVSVGTTVKPTELYAENNGTSTLSSSMSLAKIDGGNSNSLSAAAVGASSSNSVSSLVQGGSISGDVTVGSLVGSSDNYGHVTISSGTISTAEIVSGNGNSISVAGVGASTSSSVTTTALGDGIASGAVKIGDGLGDVKLYAFNYGTGTVSVSESSSNTKITAGNSNSISMAAVGASASSSVSNIAVLGTIDTDTTVNATSLTAENYAAVTMDGGMSNPQIVAGNSNSISLAAVGASSSNSVTSLVDTGSIIGDVAVRNVTGGSTNGGAVTVSHADVTAALISGGTGNSISVAGVGASSSNSISGTYVGSGNVTGPITVGTIGMTSNNSGTVGVTGDFGTSTSVNGVDKPSIAGGYNNQMSIAGVGASSSSSITNLYDNSSPVTVTTVGAVTNTATNTGAVTVTANIYNATITSGIGNGISAAAVGASAAQSFNVVVQ